jgi:hypothetical protein
MSKYPLVDAAAKYTWSKNGQEVFQDFFQRNAALFKDAPLKEDAGEQNLACYELFQEYLRLYENVLSDYITSLDVSIEEFYRQLADVKDDPNIKDKKLLHFVNYLLACTDYASFHKMMVRAAKKYNAVTGAEEKAESKSEGKSDDSPRRAAAKGARDSDDEKDSK